MKTIDRPDDSLDRPDDSLDQPDDSSSSELLAEAASVPASEAARGMPPEFKPLPADASAEEKDRHWYTTTYQGDRVPQLTLRAIAMGALLGMVMSISNIYTVMKVGWSFGVSVTSCVLSFVGWNALRSLSGKRLTPMSILENNCMQSTASAAGSTTGAALAVTFGALLILDPAHHQQAWWVMLLFIAATGAMGVFLAIPLKRQLINQEQLPFPDGIATATTLRSLYGRGREALNKAYAMVSALAVGAVVAVLSTAEDQFVALGRFFAWMREHLFSVHLPDQVPERGIALLDGKPMTAFGFEPSVLMIGAGIIVGPRVSFSMLASSGALYFFIAPWLHAMDVPNAGVAGYVVSIPTAGGGAMFNPVRWALWGGVSVLVFASLTVLALQWRTVGRAFTGLRRATAQVSPESAIGATMAAIEVPNAWLIVGMIPITIVMVLLQILAFGVAWWVGLVAVAMSFVLALVACRAAGETNIPPLGPMGKVMQLLFALISPPAAVGVQASMTHNVMAAGITANSAGAAADLLFDLKSGYLLGANPRRQFIAQLLGVLFGTLASVPAWFLMVPDVSVLDKYPLPATQMWVAVARALTVGLDSLPMSAKLAVLIGAAVGIGLPLLERLLPKVRAYLPSATGLGLGWVIYFSAALAFSVGALLAMTWRRAAPASQEVYAVPIASGLIAGESIVKAILAMAFTTVGLLR
jgi:putative OPT family oligopeptide transporter